MPCPPVRFPYASPRRPRPRHRSAREVVGTRGRGPIQKWFKVGDKHTEEGHQKKKMLDGLLGNAGGMTGEILIQWEVSAAPN